MLKYECPHKCTLALPLVLTSSCRYNMCTVQLNHQIQHHPTNCPLSTSLLYVCPLLTHPPALSPSAPLLKSKTSAEECHHEPGQGRGAALCLCSSRGKKSAHGRMMLEWFGHVWQLWPSGKLSCSYDREVQVELHQGLALIPFLFTTAINRLLL